MWHISSAFGNLGKSIDENGQQVTSWAGKAAPALGAIGIGFIALAAGFALFAKSSVTAAASFDKQMTMMTTQAGAARGDIAGFGQQILLMAGQVGSSADDLAKAGYHIVSLTAGTVDYAHSMDILRVAAEGAKVGGSDLSDTATALGAVVINHVKDLKNWGDAMGMINSTVGAGNMRMQDFADTMTAKWVPVGVAAGLSFQSMGGALATMTDLTGNASNSAQSLTRTMLLMLHPSGVAAKALAGIGLTSTQLAEDMHGPKGMIGALEDLQAHLQASGKDSTEQAGIVAAAFGGQRGSAGVLMLLNNMDRLREKTDMVGKGAGKFASDWALTTQTVAFQMDALKAGVNAVMIAIGQGLEPIIAKLLQFLAPIVSRIMAWVIANKELVSHIIVFGGILTAVTGLFLIFASAILMAGMIVAAAAASPFALLIGAIVAVGMAVGTLTALFFTFHDTFMRIIAPFQGVINAFLSFGSSVMGIFGTIGAFVSQNEALLISLGKVVAIAAAVAGALALIVTVGGAIISFFTALGMVLGAASGIVEFAAGLAAFSGIAGAIGSALMTVIGPIAGILAVMTPLGWVIVGIGVAVALMITHWNQTVAVFQQVAGAIAPAHGALATIIGGIQMGLGPLQTFRNILYAFGVSWQDVGAIIAAGQNIWSGLIADLYPIGAAIGKIGDAFNSIGASIRAGVSPLDIFRNILLSLGMSWQDIGGIIGTAQNAFKEIGQDIMNILNPEFSFLRTVIDTVMGSFRQIVGQLEGPVQAAFSGVSHGGNLIRDAFNIIKGVVLVLAGIFTNVIVPAINGLIWGFTQIFSQVMPALADAFKELWPVIGQLTDIAGALVTMFISVAQTVSVWLIAAFNFLKPALIGLAAVFAIVGVLLAALVVGVFKALIEFFKVFLPAAINLAVAIIKIFVDIIQLIVVIITGVVKIVADIFRGDWGAAWQDMYDMVAKAIGLVWDILVNLWKGIVALFQGAIVSVLAAMGGFVTGVIGFFQGLWDKLIGHSIVPQIIGDTVNLFAGMPSRVLSAIGDFAGMIGGKIGEAIGAIARAAPAALAAAISIGKNIVTGILHGIGNLITSNPITGALAGALPQGIKDALGIKSPSTLFAQQVGLPIIQGIAQGIVDNKHMAVGALTALGKELSDKTTVPVANTNELKSANMDLFTDKMSHFVSEAALSLQNHTNEMGYIAEKRAAWISLWDEKKARMADASGLAVKLSTDANAATNVLFDAKVAALHTALQENQKATRPLAGNVMVQNPATETDKSRDPVEIMIQQRDFLKTIRDVLVDEQTAGNTNTGTGANSKNLGSPPTGVESALWTLIESATSTRQRGIKGR